MGLKNRCRVSVLACPRAAACCSGPMLLARLGQRMRKVNLPDLREILAAAIREQCQRQGFAGEANSSQRQKHPASGWRLGCVVQSWQQRESPGDPPLRADARDEGRRRLGVMNAEAIAGRSAKPKIAALILLEEANMNRERW